MPRPSRTTAHYLAENAPTATRGPSRASGFVLRREAAIEHDTDDGRFFTQQRTCGRSVAALGEPNIGKLYRKIRKKRW
jgi:hypothetical protein